jgi:hypothetical protein
MTDVTTHKPLYVEIESAGPLLTVPVCQLDQIRQLLDRHGIRYEVDEYAISLDGGPEETEIRFGRRGDPHAIQTILDSVP